MNAFRLALLAVLLVAALSTVDAQYYYGSYYPSYYGNYYGGYGVYGYGGYGYPSYGYYGGYGYYGKRSVNFADAPSPQ